ncbi:hypothetical protein EG328_007909 [Venturia inaequalis]|uniref:ubiquitinyl hydrolase 1 n=1 Tax=Venturia inaequalis TaxID=5025 RepID=A0A8H3UE02_VENIN|nr:hypothetical protein EG328_007909 [Venturia inaequalis]
MDEQMPDFIEDKVLKDLLVHVLLPPDCPQKRDANLTGIDSLLLHLVHDSVTSFAENCADEVKTGWQHMERMMTQWVDIQQKHSIHSDKLEEALSALSVNDGIALHIKAQNAGVIVRRPDANHVQFELFEASPMNQDMKALSTSTASGGRLIRSFPGNIIVCPWTLVLNDTFLPEFCSFVAKLHEQTVLDFQNSMGPPPSQGQPVKADPLDSEHPGMVTELLSNILAPHGQVLAGGVITKHTREECLYSGKGHPWRRTSLWIVIRVALERALSHAFPSDDTRNHYKNFMLYFLSRLAEQSRAQNIPLETQHLLSVKIARRMFKLGSHAYSFVSVAAISAAKANHEVVRSAWREVQEASKDSAQIPRLETKIRADRAILRLDNSRQHISRAIENPHISSALPYTPPKSKRLRNTSDGLPQISLDEASKSPMYLADFEYWVAHDLPTWLDDNDQNQIICISLGTMMKEYLSVAMKIYSGCPERFSTGILTALDLWVALDRAQCALNPLVSHYSPGIPKRILEPLLLRKRDHIVRLTTIENYLQRRNGPLNSESLDIFQNMKEFFVEFFDQSQFHQRALKDIEEDIDAKVQDQTSLWQAGKERYTTILQEAKDMAHVAIEKSGGQDHLTAAPADCDHCLKKEEAGKISVPVWERPLPEDSSQRKMIVVELNLPAGFKSWRDATWTIILDLGLLGIVEPKKSIGRGLSISDYKPLFKQLQQRSKTSGARITLCASTRPRTTGVKFRKMKDLEVEDVCLSNPSVWAFCDTEKEAWIKDQKEIPDFRRYCGYKLPEGPYHHLQSTMTAAIYTDNEILAKQAQCVLGLSLKEHYAFGSLRAGRRLRLKNILRALAANTLNMKTLAVQTLILQTVWEVGPPHEPENRAAPADLYLRVGYADLDSKRFCAELLSAVDGIVVQSGSSWSEENLDALLSAVVLILKILSFATSEGIRAKARDDLRLVRRRAIVLLTRLSTHQNRSSSPRGEGASTTLLFKAANLVKMTYDVNAMHIGSVLNDSQDVEDLTTALLLAQENAPLGEDLQPHTREMRFRGFEISRALEQCFRILIPSMSSAITAAIMKKCTSLTFDKTWNLPQDYNSSSPWIENRTSGPNPRLVHFSILTGQLLVQGRQIQRIPDEIARDSLYQQLFGEQPIHVMPSEVPGMHFTAVNNIMGHKIHFRTCETKIVIRAGVQERLLEAVPSSIFKGDLPAWFITEFVHFLDLSTGLTEFRLKESPWENSPDTSWSLDFLATSGPKLSSSMRQLVPSHHFLCEKIHSILSNLEVQEHILVFWNSAKFVEIELRRYGLRFSISSEGELISKDYDAIVDSDQDIGSLYGLHNKLVLRSRDKDSQTCRQILIPFGPVSISKHANHVAVQIDIRTHRHVQHFSYQCDKYLKIIQGSSDRLPSLYLAYLHAVTSSVLQDPFTEQTGTNRALQILRSSVLSSTEPLACEEVSMLELVAGLTPDRQYKKGHKLQCIQWQSDLSPFCQHEDFYVAAKAIKDLSDTFTIFYNKKSGEIKSEEQGLAQPKFVIRDNPELHERAKARNAWFRAPSVGQNSQYQDISYHARDGRRSPSGESTFLTSDLLRRWPSNPSVSEEIFKQMRTWEDAGGFGVVYTPKSLDETHQVPLGRIWGSLFQMCMTQGPESKWKLIFLLGQVSFKPPGNFVDIKTLCAIATSGQFREYDLPELCSYSIKYGLEPSIADLKHAITAHAIAYRPPTFNRSKQSERSKKKQAQELAQHKKEVEEQAGKLCDHFARQWPTTIPTAPSSINYSKILMQKVVRSISELFQKVHQNMKLKEWVEQLQQDLIELPEPEDEGVVPILPTRQPLATSTLTPTCPDLLEILKTAQPPTLCRLEPGLTIEFDTISPNTNDLEAVLRPYCTQSDDTLSEAFGRDLIDSVHSYSQSRVPIEPDSRGFSQSTLKDHAAAMKLQYEDAFAKILTASLPEHDLDNFLSSTGVWAEITSRSILALLARPVYDKIPANWQQALVEFASRLALFQRSERLVKASKSELMQELQCAGQKGWSAKNRPEWLLLEIENGITIRPEQAEMANEMIAPRSESNSIFQLAMGGGKTKVIIPMVLAVIADGKTLARLLTMKPLLRQTLAVTKQRLGGLIDRPVYHLPFSRSSQLTLETADLFKTFYEEVSKLGGVVIQLPEEVLSFKLAVQESMKSSPVLGLELWKVLKHLTSASRDIIDEADEVLDLKSQLVYTMNEQQQMQGHPKRWLIILEIIGRIGIHASHLGRRSQRYLQITKRGPGQFPSIRCLKDDASQALIANIVIDIECGRIGSARMDHLPPDLCTAVMEFISNRNCDRVTAKKVEMGLRHDPHTWSSVLLLRGLIGCGTLRHTLEQKRFFVDFGLSLERTLLAVPYLAKGCPNPSSEFAQPEVTLILTVLAYYYHGLAEFQVRQVLSLLFEENDASSEYASWIPVDSDIPQHLRVLKNINLDDEPCCSSLFPKLRHCQGILNFYLKKICFPKYALEFTKRLCASAWDLPSSNPHQLSVGFSGTDDNRTLLPLSTKQYDLPSQKKTNAMILDHLLRNENQSCVLAADEKGCALTTQALLKQIIDCEPEPSVIIDVGAQILDLTNREVASHWLDMRNNSHAAIYFDQSDEPQVLARDGAVCRLAVSPLRNRLENVLVFLDQAHCRGSDLPISPGARAAVILGPRTSKERLVQACMRMRKLGSTHSLVFVAPPDVHRSILHSSHTSDTVVTSADILIWCISQTLVQLKKNAIHWIAQGADHARREHNLTHYLVNGNLDNMMGPKDPMIQDFMGSMLQSESRSLAELYGYCDPGDSSVSLKLSKIDGLPTANELLSRWRQLDPSQHEALGLDEEAEREVSVEVQQQKIVQHPCLFAAKKPVLHSEVQGFVKSGKVNTSRFRAGKDLPLLGIYPAYATLERTSAVQHKDTLLWKPEDLYVTRDFVESVDIPDSADIDHFLRPVQWILTSTISSNILIISPFEADELHDAIKISDKIRLISFAPRVSKTSSDLSSLNFLNVSGEEDSTRSPPSQQAIRDINLFAGSTYLNSYEEYESLGGYLGIVKDMKDQYNSPGLTLGSDGFVDAAGRKVLGWPVNCPFTQTPIPFFQAFYSLRMKGQDFSETHFGSICASKRLTEEDFGEVVKVKQEIKKENREDESLFVPEDSSMQDGVSSGAPDSDMMDID